MSALSDYLEVELVKHIFRTGSFTKPTALYVALYTAAPGDTGGGTEVTGTGYARINLAPLDANWDATSGTDGLTANTTTITFGTPTANWGTITHFGIHSAVTSGNLLFHGALNSTKIVNSGDPAPTFPAGNLTITFS